MSTRNSKIHGKHRLAIVHWFPLEQFPPAQNLINFFTDHAEFQVLCCSTIKKGEKFTYSNSKALIHRTKFPSRDYGRIARLIYFLFFPISTFLKLLFFRPHSILYLEPHSAPAIFLYSLLFPDCRLFAHYHEYREPQHLSARGNSLAKIGNWFEKVWLYRKLEWISQTNEDRIRLFLADYPNVNPNKLHSLPNMPPRKWLTEINHISKDTDHRLKLVYIGAISLHDTYLESLLKWFSNFKNDNITLDLYINNIDQATDIFLANSKQQGLTVHLGGVPYNQLPTILPNYDIGLIIYRCNTMNYVYNAPNKLFEYLMCGLNVIYPKQMLGVAPYAREDSSPWVKAIDFEKIHELSINALKTLSPPQSPYDYSCEIVYKALAEQILI